MEIYEIPGTGFSSNVFLVKGSERTMIVDAGLMETSTYVMEKISSHIDPKDVDIIFLSHRHCDHIGGTKALLDNTSAEVFAPTLETPAIINGDDTTGARMFGVRVDPVPVTGVEEEHIFDLGDCSFKVLHTPGHTCGSACLFDEKNGVLLAGDTVFAGGGVGRWDLPTGSLDDLKSSLDRLCQLPIESVYPGHGPSIAFGALDSIRTSRRSLEGFWK